MLFCLHLGVGAQSKHSDIKSLYNSDWHYESNSASRYFVVNWGKRKSSARGTAVLCPEYCNPLPKVLQSSARSTEIK